MCSKKLAFVVYVCVFRAGRSWQLSYQSYTQNYGRIFLRSKIRHGNTDGLS